MNNIDWKKEYEIAREYTDSQIARVLAQLTDINMQIRTINKTLATVAGMTQPIQSGADHAAGLDKQGGSDGRH